MTRSVLIREVPDPFVLSQIVILLPPRHGTVPVLSAGASCLQNRCGRAPETVRAALTVPDRVLMSTAVLIAGIPARKGVAT